MCADFCGGGGSGENEVGHKRKISFLLCLHVSHVNSVALFTF